MFTKVWSGFFKQSVEKHEDNSERSQTLNTALSSDGYTEVIRTWACWHARLDELRTEQPTFHLERLYLPSHIDSEK